MKKSFLNYTVISLLFFSGCSGMKKSYQDQVCNESGGYEHGMNDARAGNPMDLSFAQACEAETKAPALAGYRNGYTTGLASVQAEKPSTEINVNIGGHSDHKFYCEVHAFTKKFAAWGATELEARVNAKQKCAEEYNEMHCGEVSCRH